MDFSLLDRLVRTLQVHEAQNMFLVLSACQTADGVARAAWVCGCRSSRPTGSNRGPLSAAGLAMMLFGHGVRLAAFVTAGSNFSHLVETGARWIAPSCLVVCVFWLICRMACAERRPEHQLVTNGIYGYSPPAHTKRSVV